jgi:hypothetical protein
VVGNAGEGGDDRASSAFLKAAHREACRVIRAALDAFDQRLSDAFNRTGFAFSSATVLFGKKVLRFCTVNPNTTDEDIEEVVARLETRALELLE